MSGVNYDLNRIKAVVFDVDGVLSPSTIPMNEHGEPMRMANIKDGYAIQFAVKCGIKIAIITGANTESVVARFNALGVKDVYIGASYKSEVLKEWMAANELKPADVAYIGDDIPDYEVMQMVGLPIAPADAALDIRRIAKHISQFKGGDGVARDFLEQLLRAKGMWKFDARAFGW